MAEIGQRFGIFIEEFVRLDESGNGFLVFALCGTGAAQNGISDPKIWVELECAVDLTNGFLILARVVEHGSENRIHEWRERVPLQGLPDLCQGRLVFAPARQ